MNARNVVLVGWLGVLAAIASRGLVMSIVGRRVDATVETLAQLAARLPSPRTETPIEEAPLPPPPPIVASAIASTSPSANPPTKIAPSGAIANSSKKQAPNALVVTRAEIEDAIATKGHGVKATLVRDETGAPMGLVLHRVGPLARFGIAEGDVLVAANGLPLRTPDDALAALGSLKEAKRVAVALRRGDATYVVTVDVAETP